MTTCSLANADRLEVGTLDEDVLRLLGDARIQTSEHAGDTHRFSLVADHKVGRRQLALYAVQSNKRCTFGTVTDNNMITFDLIRIKSMQSLTILMQHEVCDIHNIVDRSQADGSQCFLQPIRTLLDLYATNHHTTVTRACLSVLHTNGNRAILLIDTEAALIRAGKGNIILTVCLIVSIQVTCYTVMRDSIRTVRRDIHLDERIVLQMKILAGRHAYRCILGQNHDSRMVGAYTYLIFCTYHTPRLFTTDLAFLDGERLLAAIEHCTDSSHNNLLSGCHVRCTTDYLHWAIRCAEIDSGDMQVIGIGVLYTCQHMTDHQAFQSATDRLYLFNSTHLQTYGGKDGCYFLGIVGQRDVAFEPIVRNIHVVLLLFVVINQPIG